MEKRIEMKRRRKGGKQDEIVGIFLSLSQQLRVSGCASG